MKNTPMVSIVMPAFNAGRTIGAAIDSILSQTFHDFELIICDDASTDDTKKIIDSYSDNRIVYINNPNNLGPGLSRDRAIEFAKGKWIAFTDADDTWLPERLEILLAATNQLENVMIFDDIMKCHDTSNGMYPWRIFRGSNSFGTSNDKAIEVSIEKYIRSGLLLIKPLTALSIIKKYQIRHSCRAVHEDNEFFLELLSHDLMLKFIPKPMYYYRITPGSETTHSNRNTLLKEVLEAAIPKFNHSASIQEALKSKISMTLVEEQYTPFLLALKQKKFIEALNLAYQYPWLVRLFFARLGGSLAYHSHRIWHRGYYQYIR